MPKRHVRKEVLSRQPWWTAKHISTATSRQNETASQQARLPFQDHGATAAMLHGRRGGGSHNNDHNGPVHHAKQDVPKRFDRTRKNIPGVLGSRRKAEFPAGRSSKRQQLAATHAPVYDEEYIRQTISLPTIEQYPKLPPGMLDLPKQNFIDLTEGHGKTDARFSMATNQQRHICRLAYEDSHTNHFTTVLGEGQTKKLAEKAAYLHLIGVLHKEGLLEAIFQPISGEVDDQTLRAEVKAKIDIYNYAARYDAVPKFSMRLLQLNAAQRVKGKGRRQVEITVELPDQGIRAVGKGSDMKKAEIASAVLFKREAEVYNAKSGSGPIFIRDSSSLNSDNARQFIDYVKASKNLPVEIVLQKAQDLRHFGFEPLRAQALVDNKPTGEPVEMIAKKDAEDMACLTCAIALKSEYPDAYAQFLSLPKSSKGEILQAVGPVTMPIDGDCILMMRETLLAARANGLPDEHRELAPEVEARRHKTRPRIMRGTLQMSEREANLQKAYRDYQTRPELEDLRQKRSELPMNSYQAQIIDMIGNNIYSIIVGATGSGKTTQVPQVLLDDAIKNGTGASCNIVCTQPRRIAAVSVAKRVAEERAEKLQGSVGYQVRFDAKLPQFGGSMTYCTTGILLQQLQNAPDETFDSISHIIIDEVHERDLLIDFLLIILKKVMARRAAEGKPTPKVILMSATIDTELFANYFKSASSLESCPVLSVPGRTFPVKDQYLDDLLWTLKKDYPHKDLDVLRQDRDTAEYLAVEKENSDRNRKSSMSDEGEDGALIIDWKQRHITSENGEVMHASPQVEGLMPLGLVATTIAHVVNKSQDGAVLVFLPGLEEIIKVENLLKTNKLGNIDFKNDRMFKIFLLHSSIPAGQTEVFDPAPPGVRKIILATNIAETSITIPDVQHVVDTGKLREKQYDQVRRITRLQCTWISKSNSRQRAGRAGRVTNGNYYALFTKERYEQMRVIGLPEILRTDLQETCLDIKAQSFNTPIRDFLAQAIEPPLAAAVDTSVTNLQALDALTDDESITPLGRLLAKLPVHPALGKMIVLGIIFRCLDPMLILGAAAEERSIFTNPLGLRHEAHSAQISFVQGSSSDHIAMLNAVRALRVLRDQHGYSAMQRFANDNFLHLAAFRSIEASARQIEEILVEHGLIRSTPSFNRHNSELGDPVLNENSAKVPVIKALSLAGLHPNLAVATGGKTWRTPNEKNAIVHPSSTNALLRVKDREGESHTFGTLCSYNTMAKSNDGGSIFLRGTSEVTPLMATLFGGRLNTSAANSNIIQMDKWLQFFVKSDDRRAVKTTLEFRKALERLLTGTFMDLAQEKRSEGGGFLADDKVREIFAEGLVGVLARDIAPRADGAKKGWGRGDGTREARRDFGGRRRLGRALDQGLGRL
ncbi:hypothetical protein MMC09_003331 [Bachmanniomyces sp. S44760]|nr:hypothetical protein [Bachmanniomyces sp. S44760]